METSMTEELFNPSWYRIAELKPRLRSHIQIHQHRYRGEVWYVLQDTGTGRHFRFTPATYKLLSLMDGQRNVQTIWDMTLTELGDDAPTQGEVIELLAQLHAADALQCDISPDSEELFRRYQKTQRRNWKQRLMTPLAIRLPLFDPQDVLDHGLPWVRPLFSWWAFVIWLIVVVLATILAGSHWPELKYAISEQALAPKNLLVLWLVYPLVKALHEFGHAFATRVWGGEVHEMGVLFLVFIPIPYVEASAASAFPDKRKRMMVGAAGMIVELFLAAIALFVWLNSEPGIIQIIAFNIMLIGSVSTLLFNGNPLLRYDGYYILLDAVETPNLATRANNYLGYLIQHHLFGVDKSRFTLLTQQEHGWLAVYSIASFTYRIFILAAITLFVAGKFFVIGVLLAIWALLLQVLLPAWKMIRFVLTGSQLREQRLRAVSTSGAILLLCGLLLFVAPLPLTTHAYGVVWLPEQAYIRTGTDCFVKDILAERDSNVKPGQALIACDDPVLRADVKQMEAKLQEYQARLNAETVNDRVKADILQDDMITTRAELARARERLAQLEIRSEVAGTFVVPNYQDLVGQYLPQGKVLAYVIDPKLVRVRTVVEQGDISLVREQTDGIDVRLAGSLGDVIKASIKQEVPAATDQLPSAALSTVAGGPYLVDPKDDKHLQTLRKIFQFELLPNGHLPANAIGKRVYVRFEHGNEPVGFRLWRLVRRLFLRKLNV